ncbi:hypothetical protein [Agromyces larvae]|uniref:Nucleotide exchange factor GrpE n=1 Tax=Agromyces larvae TaxID=2929802 RepID=A0ABY4CAX9_9MICO|nr:hypothetical protein [Agromyces larvae]UOE45850.1 hypothetical protein MTO99_08945 [Agromyces larvae]
MSGPDAHDPTPDRDLADEAVRAAEQHQRAEEEADEAEAVVVRDDDGSGIHEERAQ